MGAARGSAVEVLVHGKHLLGATGVVFDCPAIKGKILNSTATKVKLAVRGRDHWPECWSILIGGGGIRGGVAVGASDERGATVADRMVSIDDAFATVYKAMGIDWTLEYMHPMGRPLKIANGLQDVTGIPIQELI